MSKLSKKSSVSISILIAFLIAFSFLFIFLKNNSQDLSKWENEFYSQNFDDSRKIFILGSSHTGHLNATSIENYLSIHFKDHRVYNLSITGDRPSQRLGTIDQLISAKPDLVIYGVGFRDFENIAFENTNELNSNMMETILPNPIEFLKQTISLHLLTGYDFNFLQSPKGITFKFIHDILVPSDSSTKLFVENMPFFHPEPRDIKINVLNSTPEYFMKVKQAIHISFTGIKSPEKNMDVFALNKILTKLRENNIKVIIFTTPYYKTYFDMLPNSYESVFDSIIDDIDKQNNVKNYLLHKKYTNYTNIWTDFNHVALNQNVNIYNEDIAEIILNEIEP
jgi:hypothetical protein